METGIYVSIIHLFCLILCAGQTVWNSLFKINQYDLVMEDRVGRITFVLFFRRDSDYLFFTRIFDRISRVSWAHIILIILSLFCLIPIFSIKKKKSFVIMVGKNSVGWKKDIYKYYTRLEVRRLRGRFLFNIHNTYDISQLDRRTFPDGVRILLSPITSDN